MPTPTLPSPAEEWLSSFRVPDALYRVIMGMVTLWAALCLLAAYQLRSLVPVSRQDLADASWLSYTFSMHSGYLAYILGWMVIVTALALHRRVTPLLVSFLLGAFLLTASNTETLFRVSTYVDSAKIGCFVPGTKECLEMLHLPATNAPSLYQPTKAGHADDYPQRPVVLVTPGVIAFLQAPLVWWHADELAKKLESQRAEVARLRQLAAP